MKKIDLSNIGLDFSRPRKYWLWFLFFSAVLFFGTIILSAYLFLKLSSKPPTDSAIFETAVIKINLSGLDEAVKALEDRETGFKEILVKPLIKDPSL